MKERSCRDLLSIVVRTLHTVLAATTLRTWFELWNHVGRYVWNLVSCFALFRDWFSSFSRCFQLVLTIECLSISAISHPIIRDFQQLRSFRDGDGNVMVYDFESSQATQRKRMSNVALLSHVKAQQAQIESFLSKPIKHAVLCHILDDTNVPATCFQHPEGAQLRWGKPAPIQIVVFFFVCVCVFCCFMNPEQRSNAWASWKRDRTSGLGGEKDQAGCIPHFWA